MPQPTPAPTRSDSPRVRPETMHDREEVGQEVASDLTLAGVGAYLSASAKGVNLLAANAALTATVPVRVVTDPAGTHLRLKADDARLLADANGVVAFLLGEPDDRERFYLPAAQYLSRAALRDGRYSLDFDAHARWLRGYAGHPGVRRAFARLARKPAPRVVAGG